MRYCLCKPVPGCRLHPLYDTLLLCVCSEPAHDRMFDDIGPQMRPMQPRKHSQKEEEDRQNKARKETEKQQQLTIERNKRRMN